MFAWADIIHGFNVRQEFFDCVQAMQDKVAQHL